MLGYVRVVGTLRLLTVLSFVSVAPHTWAQPATVSPQLREREQALATALQANDRAGLEAILDADYVLRGAPDVSREEWLTRALGYCWGQTFSLDEFAAREESGTSIASFVMTFDQDPITCEPATRRSLITDVWIRRGPEWKLLVRHSSGVAEGSDAASLQQQFAVVPAPDPVWRLESELSFVATSGNTDTQTVGTTSDLRHRTDTWQTTARAAFLRSTADGIESARSLTFEVRPGRKITPRLTLFARGGFRQDRFSGIDSRISLGSGLAYSLVDTPNRAIQFEGGMGFDRERRINSPQLRFATAQTRARFRWRLTPSVLLADEPAASTDVENPGNSRATNAASLTVALNRTLALKLSHTLEYLNEPVPGFGKLDTITSVGLVVNVER